jgi:hypothetical protein
MDHLIHGCTKTDSATGLVLLLLEGKVVVATGASRGLGATGEVVDEHHLLALCSDRRMR